MEFYLKRSLICFLGLLIQIYVVTAKKTRAKPEDTKVVKAIVESCAGCKKVMNSYPEVVNFINYDLHKYKNIEFKPINASKVQLVLLNKKDEIIEIIPMGKYNQVELNELMAKYGFEMVEPEEGLLEEDYGGPAPILSEIKVEPSDGKQGKEEL